MLRTSTVTAHLASRTIRFATDRLTALAQAKGAIESQVPEVLFVCEQNAGRSQMAAVLTNHLGGGRVHVRSAGSAPSREISSTVAAVMAEIGLDLAEEFPKPLTDDVVQAADVVVTMGCGDACPVYPGKRYQDWDLVDPAGLPIEEVRRIRDEVRDRVAELLAAWMLSPQGNALRCEIGFPHWRRHLSLHHGFYGLLQQGLADIGTQGYADP